MFEKKKSGLLRTETAGIRTMCEMKLTDRRNKKKLMQMLDVSVPNEIMARAATVR